MYLSDLRIDKFRNIMEQAMNPVRGFNIIVGDNGSGKTNILEAIYYLANVKSFRCHNNLPLINSNHHKFNLFCKVINNSSIANLPVGNQLSKPLSVTNESVNNQQNDKNLLNNEILNFSNTDFFSAFPIIEQELTEIYQLNKIGIEYQSGGNNIIKLNDKLVKRKDLIGLLPVQVIDTYSNRLLNDLPQVRRQFIDWGVAHIDSEFIPLWQRYSQTLRHRNSALKNGLSGQNLVYWDEMLIDLNHKIDEKRRAYWDDLFKIFLPLWQELFSQLLVSYEWDRGWPKDIDFRQALVQSYNRDRHQMYTSYGVHRANLNFFVGKRNANSFLSQGQQKMIVYSLKLAQGKLLKEKLGYSCVYLIDDLSTELDRERRKTYSKLLCEIEAQVFVTGVFKEDMIDLTNFSDYRVFRVSEGVAISEI